MPLRGCTTRPSPYDLAAFFSIPLSFSCFSNMTIFPKAASEKIKPIIPRASILFPPFHCGVDVAVDVGGTYGLGAVGLEPPPPPQAEDPKRTKEINTRRLSKSHLGTKFRTNDNADDVTGGLDSTADWWKVSAIQAK